MQYQFTIPDPSLKKAKQLAKLFLLLNLLLMIGWIYAGYWWIGCILLGLSLFPVLMKINKQININEEQIQFHSLYTKTIEWIEVQHIVLKDGLLTLDFRNNKILQVLIAAEMNKEEVATFNEFCLQQINQAGK